MKAKIKGNVRQLSQCKEMKLKKNPLNTAETPLSFGLRIM
jgi:hypothetical protein